MAPGAISQSLCSTSLLHSSETFLRQQTQSMALSIVWWTFRHPSLVSGPGEMYVLGPAAPGFEISLIFQGVVSWRKARKFISNSNIIVVEQTLIIICFQLFLQKEELIFAVIHSEFTLCYSKPKLLSLSYAVFFLLSSLTFVWKPMSLHGCAN